LANAVLDPAMAASSGVALIETPAIGALVRELFPHADLAMPNRDEASLLAGRPLRTLENMESSAIGLLARGAHAVLMKGGHLPGETVTDLLLTAGGERRAMSALRIETANMHGTGCTLSSAIAAHLALGASLPEAVSRARDYVREAPRADTHRHGRASRPITASRRKRSGCRLCWNEA
jgi:hydroxymethylpyrimidine/phosphomethylpyrimidine kinase